MRIDSYLRHLALTRMVRGLNIEHPGFTQEPKLDPLIATAAPHTLETMGFWGEIDFGKVLQKMEAEKRGEK